MKVLVVYAHPNPESFNHAILEAFTDGLKAAGHTYEVVDLYARKLSISAVYRRFSTRSSTASS